MLLQLATVCGESRRSLGANQNGVLHAETPRPRVQPAVAYRDDHIGLKRLWLFLAVEEGMARRQGGLLELDTHAVYRRPKDVLLMPGLFKSPMDGLFKLDHGGPCLDLGDRGLLSFQ